MNHEELRDAILAYVGCRSAWEDVGAVAIERDGTVVVEVLRRTERVEPTRIAKRFDRMRREAHARDEAALTEAFGPS